MQPRPAYVENDPRWQVPMDRTHLRFWAMAPHLAALACIVLAAFNFLFAIGAVAVAGVLLGVRWGDGRFVRAHAVSAIAFHLLMMVLYIAILVAGIADQLDDSATQEDAADRMMAGHNLARLLDFAITVGLATLAAGGRMPWGSKPADG